MPTKLKYSHHAEIVNRSNNGLREDGVVNPVVCLNAELKEILKAEKREQDVENFKENEINWLEGEFWDSWDKVKGHFHKTIKPSPEKEFEVDEIPKMEKGFFLSHSNDVIRGKPQLIDTVMKTIPLIRLTSPIKEDSVEDDDGKKEKYKFRTAKYFFFDERYDKRYDGALLDSFSLDFWIYKIITEEGKDYFVLTQKTLPNQICTFKGMGVPVDDYAEMSRNLKLKSLSRLFFLKDFKPDVQILEKEDLVKLTKQKEINESEWDFLLSYHPSGNVNLFDDEILSLRSAFLLSGKHDGYPLHLAFVGTAGTKKSWGHLGTLDYKFSEISNVIGGGNTRAKALVPSFKEKPADIGYFARTVRVGFIDEMLKMAEFELNKHQTNIQNLFGEWNDLLDNLKRTVGSGNNNTCEVEATAKNIFVGNPLGNRETLDKHIGVLDSSMMSRLLWFIQDEEESKFLKSPESVLRISPHTSLRPIKVPESSPHTYTKVIDIFRLIENRKKSIVLGKCWGKVGRSDFLTIYDSCNSFVCNIDFEKVMDLVNITSALAKEPLKSSVWMPRAEHHITLLVDGLCKNRCLFKDYDSSFTAKQEDYDLAERILRRMVKGWDTDLQPKEDFNR